jgi:hypothetical protein
MENSDNHKTARILNAWAASLVAVRETENGFEYGRSAEVINATSEEEARQIGLEIACEKFSDGEWAGHSVALLRLEINTPLKVETIGVSVGRVSVIVR